MKLYVLAGLHYAPKERFITNELEEMKNLPNNNRDVILYESKTNDIFVGETEEIFIRTSDDILGKIGDTIPGTVEFPDTLKNKNGTWDEMFKRDGKLLLINTRIIYRGGMWFNEDTGIVALSQMMAKVPIKNETGDILFETNDHRIFMNIHGKAFMYNDNDFESIEVSKESDIKIEMDITDVYTDVHTWFLEAENEILDDGDFPRAVYDNIAKRKAVKATIKDEDSMTASEVLDKLQKGLIHKPMIVLGTQRDEKGYLNIPLGKVTKINVENHENDDDILFYKNLYLSISKRLISTSISFLKSAFYNNSPHMLICLDNDHSFANVHGEGFRLRQLEYVKVEKMRHINFPLNYIDLHGKNDVDIMIMFKQYTEEHGAPIKYSSVQPNENIELNATQHENLWIKTIDLKPYDSEGNPLTLIRSFNKDWLPYKNVCVTKLNVGEDKSPNIHRLHRLHKNVMTDVLRGHKSTAKIFTSKGAVYLQYKDDFFPIDAKEKVFSMKYHYDDGMDRFGWPVDETLFVRDTLFDEIEVNAIDLIVHNQPDYRVTAIGKGTFDRLFCQYGKFPGYFIHPDGDLYIKRNGFAIKLKMPDELVLRINFNQQQNEN